MATASKRNGAIRFGGGLHQQIVRFLKRCAARSRRFVEPRRDADRRKAPQRRSDGWIEKWSGSLVGRHRARSAARAPFSGPFGIGSAGIRKM
jgi:hypothetical protein